MLQDNITIPEHHQEFVSKGLRRRLTFYFILSLILIGISFYHIFKDNVGLLYPLIGFIAGNVLGFAAARIFKISWDHGEQKVTYSLDAVGIVILILYILFEWKRSEIVSYFAAGPLIAAMSFSVFAGIMYGRVIGTRRRVREVLEENAAL